MLEWDGPFVRGRIIIVGNGIVRVGTIPWVLVRCLSCVSVKSITELVVDRLFSIFFDVAAFLCVENEYPQPPQVAYSIDGLFSIFFDVAAFLCVEKNTPHRRRWHTPYTASFSSTSPHSCKVKNTSLKEILGPYRVPPRGLYHVRQYPRRCCFGRCPKGTKCDADDDNMYKNDDDDDDGRKYSMSRSYDKELTQDDSSRSNKNCWIMIVIMIIIAIENNYRQHIYRGQSKWF